MKKTRQNGQLLLTIMKISLLQLTLAVLFVGVSFAFDGKAQEMLNKSVSLKVEGMKLRTVLNQIEQQTDAKFVYNSKAIQADRKVSMTLSDKKLSEVLEMVLKLYQVSHKIIGGQIILSPAIPEKAIKTSAVNESSSDEVKIATLPIDKSITGTVSDETGSGIPGVSVAVKGTSKGTNTDVNGKFKIDVPNEQTVLVFSFVGYAPQEIKVGNQSDISVSLKADIKQLSEVVVVGYGSQKKANLTGAVDMITSEAYENRAMTNLNQGLQGVLPNLNIKMGDGKPNQAPTFNIRGTTSIGQGGSALVLIDNVEGDPSLINPNDIATITLLKDAASASIYGARGVFGVVLITTKNPTVGKTNITYSTNYSFKGAIAKPDLVSDGYTWSSMFAESFVNFGGTFPQNANKTLKFSPAYLAEFKRRKEVGGLPEVEIDPITGEYVYYGNTAYYDLLYKDQNSSNEHNLSISGSSEKASYLLTGRYLGQTGLFRYNSDDYRIFNFTGKGSIQLYPWLKINNMSQFSDMKYHNPLNVGEGGGIWRNIADEGPVPSPLLNPDGTLTASAAYNVGDFYYGKNGIDNNKKVFRNTTGFATSFFKDKFRIKGDFTIQNTDNNDRTKAVPVPYSIKPGVISYVGTTTNYLNDVYRETAYMTTNLYSEYENTFKNDHYLKFMAGYNYEQSNFKRLSAQRNGLIFEDANDINLASHLKCLTNFLFKQT